MVEKLVLSLPLKLMLKKTMTMLLVAFLINLALMPSVFANESKAEKEAKFAQKVKTEVTKLGVGTDCKIQVKLKDGTKLKGYVSEINEESFTVTDANGISKPIPYNAAKQLKGKNLAGLIIVIGIVAFFVILFATVDKDNT